MMKGSTDEERGAGASSPASTETTGTMSTQSTNESEKRGAGAGSPASTEATGTMSTQSTNESEKRGAGASEQPGDRDVQGTWGLAASEILGEQQPAGASPWA